MPIQAPGRETIPTRFPVSSARDRGVRGAGRTSQVFGAIGDLVGTVARELQRAERATAKEAEAAAKIAAKQAEAAATISDSNAVLAHELRMDQEVAAVELKFKAENLSELDVFTAYAEEMDAALTSIPVGEARAEATNDMLQAAARKRTELTIALRERAFTDGIATANLHLDAILAKANKDVIEDPRELPFAAGKYATDVNRYRGVASDEVLDDKVRTGIGKLIENSVESFIAREEYDAAEEMLEREFTEDFLDPDPRSALNSKIASARKVDQTGRTAATKRAEEMQLGLGRVHLTVTSVPEAPQLGPQDRPYVEAYYERFIAGDEPLPAGVTPFDAAVENESDRDTAIRYSKAVGMIVAPLQRQIHGPLRQTNASTASVVSGVLLYRDLIAANKDLGKEIDTDQRLLADVINSIRDGGVDDAEAIQLARDGMNQSEDLRAERIRLYDKKVKPGANAQHLRTRLEDPEWFWWDPDFIVPDEMATKYDRLVQEAFLLSGNIVGARKWAMDNLKTEWTITEVGGPAGWDFFGGPGPNKNRYVRNAAERVWARYGLSAAEIKKQYDAPEGGLSSVVLEAVEHPEKFWLEANLVELRNAKPDVAPFYYIMTNDEYGTPTVAVDKNGVPAEWRPTGWEAIKTEEERLNKVQEDAATAQDEFEKAREHDAFLRSEASRVISGEAIPFRDFGEGA